MSGWLPACRLWLNQPSGVFSARHSSARCKVAGEQELEFLYQAIGSPFGIVLKVSDFTLASQRLYATRRKAGDPGLAGLQFRRGPFDPEGELWIVKAKPQPQVNSGLPGPVPDQESP